MPTFKRDENNSVTHNTALLARIKKLNTIGIALSSERDMPRLLEMILVGAKLITRADGGTLYTVSDNQKLNIEIVQTSSLGISMGGSSKQAVQLEPVSLYRADGTPNTKLVVVHSVLNNKTVNLPDVSKADDTGFDFTGPRLYDRKMNYHTQSMLCVPMTNHDGKTIGVIQLINKQTNNRPVAFDVDDVHLLHSLASQAAIALTTKCLIDDLKALFNSFIETIAASIDETSAHTGGHCRRVPLLTMGLADAASRDTTRLNDFVLTEQERYNLEVASWLHDCGKLATPIHIVDKSSKLETVFDRIQLIDTRFEVLKRDAEITKLKRLLEVGNDKIKADQIELQYSQTIEHLNEQRDFIRQCNEGVESMAMEMQQRVKEIAQHNGFNRDGETMPLITADELENLLIKHGTLNSHERKIINNHIVVTNKMLASMRFPEQMASVPEYAGGHHERMDGKGYPLGLTRDQMSVPARVMAIADIFEALAAKDRPYKEGKKLSEALAILGKMKQRHHVDPDLFDIFIHDKVYLPFAREFMDVDKNDIEEPFEIPGYPFDMPE